MWNVTPHLWFDKEAKEAAEFYVSLFGDSKIESVSTISGTPSGDCDIVNFKLAGESFMAIGAGPYFKFNPSLSLFATFGNEAETDAAWAKFAEGWKILMPYDTYPWARKYGWLEDRYGLSWQISSDENYGSGQKVTPFLMFTKERAGKAKEAIEFYSGVFPNSKTDLVMQYEKGEGDVEGYVKHARFTLNGRDFIAMESTWPHDFEFNGAMSFIVNCQTQDEIDYFWEKLSAVPEAEQCGWLQDKYGVSWQIVPDVMGKLMGGDPKKAERVTQAFLKMKKFDIEELKRAAEGA